MIATVCGAAVPRVISYSAALSACEKALLDDMRIYGVEPNLFMFNAVSVCENQC